MPYRPSEVRKDTFGHEALFDCEPLVSVPETDGFSYSPAMDPWHHGLKVEDYAHVGNTDWFTAALIDEKLYELPKGERGKNIFGLKASPSAEPVPFSISEAEAILLGKSPSDFGPEAWETAKKYFEQMEFPPFEKVPTPPEIWRVADTYRQTVLQNHHTAIKMLLHSMYLFTSTPSKAKDQHKVELAQTIRTEIWQPMITAAARAHKLTEEQEQRVHEALDCKLFFIGKAAERKKFWVKMLEQSQGYVINKQRLFAQVPKR